mmetsp:Transcript_41052/g.66033  ORF Transcript_41052/g.66033 Transcript_41052/m.66033 type:complete len:87 (+) Transcript_41052:2-262(+)
MKFRSRMLGRVIKSPVAIAPSSLPGYHTGIMLRSHRRISPLRRTMLKNIRSFANEAAASSGRSSAAVKQDESKRDAPAKKAKKDGS